MNIPCALFAVFAFALATGCAADEASRATPKPTILNRILHPFGGGKTAEKKSKVKTSGKLVVEMKLEPQPLKLSETNRLKITLTLANRTKKLSSLEFPTSQRIEVLLKTNAGKLVEQWSQDQAFAQEVSVVAINPGERVEYRVELATRDLNPGETYLVQGFFPHHEKLTVEKTFVPEK